MLMRLTLLTICALTLTSCTQNSGRTTGEISYVAGDGSTIFVATKERQSAVTLSGKSLSGEQLSTSNWLGKVVVVNLWASWCG
ncbi:MAG: TlpA family protein disulfide reductase, partial [Actinobacteria bacterium]|nr:TlpA family protein disulfide reductase [Actinomycetota bacterium]